ncbi:MAG: 2OG-Fe(II) oxygenase [Actinomycetota bacterium]|nr:2OG-Fe(II) oxygenase [Actinomycetota bacterium]
MTTTDTPTAAPTLTRAMVRVLPDEDTLDAACANTPDWMHPAPNPFGVIFEGALSPEVCDAMIAAVLTEDTYSVSRCGAQTRQYEDEHLHALEPLTRLAHHANTHSWGYDVDPDPHAWLQSYTSGGHYKAHMDAAIGQSRKVTAVAMVCDPADYEGGDLTIRAIPDFAEYVVPRARGTVVVFQPWLIHDVGCVTAGTRRTVNLGLWGPPLR